MQREKFVDGLRSGVKFTDAERNEIVKKAVEHRGIETTGIICMEEMELVVLQITNEKWADRIHFVQFNSEYGEKENIIKMERKI